MERHKALKVLVIVVVIAAVVPAALFGDARTVEGVSGGDWWRNILLDFQTLIGGLLAVFAAWWTVDTMDRTDRTADRRHDQLIRLQTRADRLVIERLLVRHFATFRSASFDLHATNFTMEEVSDPEKFRHARIDDLVSLQRAIGRISRVTSDAKWQDAKHLFDGHLSEELEVLNKQIVELDQMISTARTFSTAAEKLERQDSIIIGKPSRWAEQEEQSRAQIRILPFQVDEVRAIITVVIRRLQNLANVYQIDVS